MSTDVAMLALGVESRGLTQGAEGLDRLTQSGERAERRVNKSTDSMSTRFQSLRRSVFSVQGLLASFGVGFTARSIINAVTEQEHVTSQLEAALVSTNNAAGQTVRGMQALGAEMQRLTKFSNEQAEAAQAVLLTFTRVSGDVFPATIRVAADLATRMGTDLNSAVQQLGRALNDPIQNLSMLTRSGIQFTTAQKDLIKELVETNRLAEAQGVILGELETQFGGSAAAARDTFGGALAALKNEFDDLLKTIGQSGSGGMRDQVEWLIENFHLVARAAEILGILIGAKVVSALIGMGAAAAVSTAALLSNELAATRAAAAHGSLAVAARASGAALRLLTGPVGLALAAGAGLLYFRNRTDDASNAADDMARSIRLLRGDMEALRAEAIKEKMGEVELALKATQREIDKIAKVWHRSQADMRAEIEPHIELLKVLGAQYGELKEMLDSVGQTPPLTVAITGGTPDSPKAIKEQLKAMEEQLAAYQMSEQGATLYKLAVEGATEAELAHAAAMLETMGTMDATAETLERREKAYEALKDAIDQESFALLSAEQQQMDSYLRQVEQLEEYFDNKEGRTDEYYQRLEQMTQNHERRISDIQQREAEQRRASEEQLQGQIQAMRMQTLSLSAGMLREMAGESKGVSLALLAIEKASAISSIFIQTRVAAMRARAELGYVAGSAAAAQIHMIGSTNMALVAATGLMQAAGAGGGGGGGSVGGHSAPPPPSAPTHPDQGDRDENRGVTQLHFHGPIYGLNEFEDVVRELIRDHTDRDAVVIGGSTRQSYEFGGR